jgi:DnaJ family protein B protein 11
MSESYYSILGVNENASADEIKKAYRSLSLKYHPDRNPNNKTAYDLFQKINNAYEVLSDEQKKKEYDFSRSNPFLNGMSSEVNMEDIIGNLFGGGMMGMGFPPFFQNGMPPGVKIHVMRGGVPMNMNMNMNMHIGKPPSIQSNLTVNMYQVYHGDSVPLEIERWVFENGIQVHEKETLYVNIPKGVDDNEIITLQGKGNIVNENNKGDVKVYIKIENNTQFERSGLDLYLNKTLTLKEALCGFSFEINHINGKSYTLNNTSKNIVSPNYKKTIANLGLTRENYTGNLILIFNIDFPSTLSDEKIEKLKEILS